MPEFIHLKSIQVEGGEDLGAEDSGAKPTNTDTGLTIEGSLICAEIEVFVGVFSTMPKRNAFAWTKNRCPSRTKGTVKYCVNVRCHEMSTLNLSEPPDSSRTDQMTCAAPPSTLASFECATNPKGTIGEH